MSAIQILSLLSVPKIGKQTVRRILEVVDPLPDGADALAGALQARWGAIRNDPRIREAPPTAAEIAAALKRVGAALNDARRDNILPIGWNEAGFPAALKGAKLPQPVLVMFARGNMKLLAEPSAAIVGIAEPTAFGKAVARRFGEIFAERRIPLITGLDTGCDLAAHEGCLKIGGREILVLAHGLENKETDAAIVKSVLDHGGCVVSETLRPGAPANEGIRLRIGLSRAVVVVEADDAIAKLVAGNKTLACLQHTGKNALPPANKTLMAAGARPLTEGRDLEAFIAMIFGAKLSAPGKLVSAPATPAPARTAPVSPAPANRQPAPPPRTPPPAPAPAKPAPSAPTATKPITSPANRPARPDPMPLDDLPPKPAPTPPAPRPDASAYAEPIAPPAPSNRPVEAPHPAPAYVPPAADHLRLVIPDNYRQALKARAGTVKLITGTSADVRELYVPLAVDVQIVLSFNEDTITGWELYAGDRPFSPNTDALRRDPSYRAAEAMAALDTKLREERERGRIKGSSGGRLSVSSAIALLPRLVITGTAGSGKTTLVRHLAASLAESGEGLKRVWPLAPCVPVAIELRPLVRQFFPSLDDPVNLDGVEAAIEPLALDDLRDPNVIFLLDGLDEVPGIDGDDRRAQIAGFLDRLLERFPEARVVITTRPYAYADWGLNGFAQIDLAPLSAGAAVELGRRFFGAAGYDPTLFRQQIERMPGEVYGNPLLCTAMALSVEGSAPLREATALKACVDALSVHWAHKRGEEFTLDAAGLDEKQWWLLLETLAFTVHGTSVEGLESAFGASAIATAAQRSQIKHVDARLLHTILAQRAGLLREVPGGGFRFAYAGLEEHLAACYLARPTQYPAVVVKCIKEAPSVWGRVIDLLPEEARRWQHDLGTLLDALIPKSLPRGKADSPVWDCVASAARIVCGVLPPEDPVVKTYRDRLPGPLAALVTAGALDPASRDRMAHWLAQLGDTRPGVGLGEDRFPDIVWCKVAPGPFPFGDESQGNGPVEVDLPAFSISKYPITVAQFATFLHASDGYRNSAWWDSAPPAPPAPTGEPNQPACGVNIQDAAVFCRWLTVKLGYEVRLPTEEEWEKAARGKDGLPYPYGGTFDPQRGGTSETGIGHLSAVGLFPDGASPCGALDMSGNCLEWTATAYDGESSVVRGGAWNRDRYAARTFNRDHLPPRERVADCGFRLVRPGKSKKG